MLLFWSKVYTSSFSYWLSGGIAVWDAFVSHRKNKCLFIYQFIWHGRYMKALLHLIKMQLVLCNKVFFLIERKRTVSRV